MATLAMMYPARGGLVWGQMRGLGCLITYCAHGAQQLHCQWRCGRCHSKRATSAASDRHC